MLEGVLHVVDEILRVFRKVVKRAGVDKLAAAAVLAVIVIAMLAIIKSHPPVREPLAPTPSQQTPDGKIDYVPLQQAIQSYIATLPGTWGVYFKDIASGQELGINEHVAIPEASCIKVPVVLYMYEQVAAGKHSWRDQVTYQQATDYESGAGALQLTIEDGNPLSLRCLATIAITISDNIAHNMLVRYFGADNIMNFIRSLGGADTTRPYGSATTTARDLGAFIEAVYKFAQQNPGQGGRLINDLDNTIFPGGLPGSLPPGLLIPHKEGAISGVDNDMGIVFCARPFILTVMSQGIGDEDAGFNDIAAVSKLCYDYQQQLPPAPNRYQPKRQETQ